MAEAAGVVVETSNGRVRGATEHRVHAFRGIPFAGPTGGAHRFRSPVPPQPWTGVRDATRFGSAFVQLPTDPDVLAGFRATPPRRQSEDALTVNVWTPGIGDGVRRPVLVWIHGGGYYTGSGFQFPYYDGAALARRGDVVVVTFNYRLGAFGFLHLGDLCGEAYAASGNAAVLDQVAALIWVRENIGQFGGDPATVTVFGSSAGGHAATALLSVPAARGLFTRVAAQSGQAVTCRNREEATRVAEAFLRALGVERRQVARLHRLPAGQLLDAQVEVAARLRAPPMELLGPLVDGDVLPRDPQTCAGTTEHVPLLIGCNADEDLCRSELLTFATRYAADLPVFVYELAWRTSAGPGGPRSCHGLEGPLVFNNPECPLVGDAPEARSLAACMSGAWAAFARHGEPSGAGLPTWPRFTQATRAMMAFDVPARVGVLRDVPGEIPAASGRGHPDGPGTTARGAGAPLGGGVQRRRPGHRVRTNGGAPASARAASGRGAER
jgi:para-nitrobenzyl esterase